MNSAPSWRNSKVRTISLRQSEEAIHIDGVLKVEWASEKGTLHAVAEMAPKVDSGDCLLGFDLRLTGAGQVLPMAGRRLVLGVDVLSSRRRSLCGRADIQKSARNRRVRRVSRRAPMGGNAFRRRSGPASKASQEAIGTEWSDGRCRDARRSIIPIAHFLCAGAAEAVSCSPLYAFQAPSMTYA